MHRIAYFSDALYMGGAEIYLYLLASNLDRERYEPVLIMKTNPALGALKVRMESAGIAVHEIDVSLGGKMKGAIGLMRLFRRLRPSLLHLNIPGPFDAQYSLVAPLARLAGVRHVVSTEHLPMVPSFPKARLLKGFATRWIGRVITVSEDNRRYLVGFHGIPDSKIRVVYIGIPDESPGEGLDIRRDLSLPDDTFLLVAVGRLTERKGHVVLLDAMSGLPDRVHLMIVGTGELEERLRGIAGEAGIGGRIHFLGRREDVPALLRCSDILVLPSILEATPYVLVEAMAAGLPVVASGIYGVPEIVSRGETGLLFPPGDSGKLRKMIKFLLEDGERLKCMGESARARFEKKFGIERCISGTTRVYGELLSGEPAARGGGG